MGQDPEAVAPDGSHVHLLVTDADRASLVEVRLPAGNVSRPVRHRSVEEIWYFTAGTGRVWRRRPDGDPGTVVQVAAGTALRIPVGSSFQFAADADAELCFLCFTSPPWPGPQEAVAVDQGGLGPPTV